MEHNCVHTEVIVLAVKVGIIWVLYDLLIHYNKHKKEQLKSFLPLKTEYFYFRGLNDSFEYSISIVTCKFPEIMLKYSNELQLLKFFTA